MQRRSQAERSSAQYTPPLTNIGWVGLAAVVLSAVGVALLFWGVKSAASPVPVPTGGRSRVDLLDVAKTTITIAAYFGAVLAAVYAYRKQRLAEGDAHRADAAQLLDRYSTAANQLGHDAAAVRLAGVYAMARLADDWPEQRQTCIDVLCAYIRMPYEIDSTHPNYRHGESEVRLSIIKTIRNHLRDKDVAKWRGANFSFERAVFDGGDFTGAHFTSGWVSFHGARFLAGTIYFSDAHFTGATVSFAKATFRSDVHFNRANFSSGRVNFTDAVVVAPGKVTFRDAKFAGTEIKWGALRQPTAGAIPSQPSPNP
jgi:hypothetical protein